LLKDEKNWYEKCARDKNFMINFISDLVEKEDPWHPSPRPDLTLTTEQTDKIRDEAVKRFEIAQKEAMARCQSEKHNFSAGEEILSNGRFKQPKKRKVIAEGK